MSQSRPPVPEAIKRKLFEEAGYRCSVPTCRCTGPFEMEHIEDWVKVKKHRFDNMVLLCRNCHGRVTSGEISKASIKSYKRNLAVINGRYSIYELRMIEAFWKADHYRIVSPSMGFSCKENTDKILDILFYWYPIESTDIIHVKGLLDDGFIELIDLPHQSSSNNKLWHVILTKMGNQFILDYFSGSEIE
jgi:HNH endonuclease